MSERQRGVDLTSNLGNIDDKRQVADFFGSRTGGSYYVGKDYLLPRICPETERNTYSIRRSLHQEAGGECGILRCSRKHFKSQTRTVMDVHESREEL